MEKQEVDQIITFVQDALQDIPFKTLQRDEVEPSAEEKILKMRNVLENDPGLFLSRWGRYLPQEVLKLFEHRRDDYEVNFHLNQLLTSTGDLKTTQRPSIKSSFHATVQNRRYAYLKYHLRETQYFSDESMQIRDPVLYEFYVGQHISEEEKNKPFNKDVNLVQRVLMNIDRQYVSDQVSKQRGIEEEQMEEEDESEDEDMEMSEQQSAPTSKAKTSASQKPSTGKEGDADLGSADLSAIQDSIDDIDQILAFRESQRQEFVRLMEEKFLAGKDADFDYSKVDYNEMYDDLDQVEQDVHDRYFDETDSESEGHSQKPSEYTGELDY